MANKKAGSSKVRSIKTKKFLPQVFQTELNNSWLDSTLDQMVSKGPLDQVDGYIGSRHGSEAQAHDSYVDPVTEVKLRKSTSLTPGIISYDNTGAITNKITYDDVVHSLNANFNEYNYNSAYSSNAFSYNPPFNIDKFINFNNYYWVEELPIYTSIYTGTSKNPLTDIQNTNVYTLVDDTNTIVLENNMLIKFVGSGYDVACRGSTYIVLGTGEGNGEHRFELYIDFNQIRVYNSVTKHTQANDGIWDNSKVHSVTPNTNNKYWLAPFGKRNYGALLTAYNADPIADRLPVFDGFIFEDVESNKSLYNENVLVKFTGTGWVDATLDDSESIYVTKRDATTGNLSIKKVIVATYDSVNDKYTLAIASDATLAERAMIARAETFDTAMWDWMLPVEPLKDYLLIEKHDVFNTAWSRANHWVNISAINKLKSIMPFQNFDNIITTKRKAIRPIIEYTARIDLWNHARHVNPVSLGTIDFGVKTGDVLSAIPVGSTYVYVDNSDTKVYTQAATPTSVTLAENNTMTIKAVLDNTLSAWVNADVYYTNSTITLAQQKTKINQYPLYKFYDHTGKLLSDIAGTNFKGEKIFGYKPGKGAVDTELGMKLSYKDSLKGAEYQFQNFILTTRYKANFTQAENAKLDYHQNLTGYSLYKKRNVLEGVYNKSDLNFGAKETVQYKITNPDTDLVIPYGHGKWRPHQEEFNVHHIAGKLAVTRRNVSDGTAITFTGTREYNIGYSHIIKFVNSTTDALTFIAPGGIDIEANPSHANNPDITIQRFGDVVKIETGSSSIGGTFDVRAGSSRIGSFNISNEWDANYFDITLNGKRIKDALVTVTGSSITIDETALTADDLVDFTWNSNKQNNNVKNYSYPQVTQHNVHNKVIKTFTISETIDHWADKLNANPSFDRNTFGENNYGSITHNRSTGGTLFLHDDIAVMNDICYSDEKLDVTGSLIEQAGDWDAFRERFKAQAKRLYSVTAYPSVQELTTATLTALLRNKRTSKLHSDSNMLFNSEDALQTFTITDTSVKEFETKWTFNGDVNIRDHVYVYLTESDGTNTYKRILRKDIDYTQLGNAITILLTYNTTVTPVLEVVYNQMDSECYVPASLVKLGLAYGTQPVVSNNILYTHDGVEIVLKANADLTNPNNSSLFDPVNAALFELETRVYAGLVKEDTTYDKTNTSSYYNFLPTQASATWYSLELLNNYLEKHFKHWAELKQKGSLNQANQYVANDNTTWNYSTIPLGFNYSNATPGHYKGVYVHLFGTATPDLTPWHMLGHSFKPTWWDANYSWVTGSKRTALLSALKNGLVSDPSGTPTHDIVFARPHWDFATKSPVTGSGTLEDLTTVIGTPASVDASSAFKFGDWSSEEYEWRVSPQGQAAGVDAIIKLNPARAWSAFFQPGIHNNGYAGIQNAGRFGSSKSYKVPGNTYGNSIINIEVQASPTTVSATESFIVLDDFGSTTATTNFKLNASSKVSALSLTNRGVKFTGSPIVSYSGGASNIAGIDFKITTGRIGYVANGLSQAQYNFILRNQNSNLSQGQLYTNLDTKLHEKLGGFSSKELLEVFAESSLTGDFEFGKADFTIDMYQGRPTRLVTASAIFITKTLTGFTLSGLSNNKQEFNFFEPNIADTTDYELVTVQGSTVRRYNKFVTTASTIEYGASVEKMQDVYNFVRGYFSLLTKFGYTLEFDGDSSASDFVNWALTADNTDTFVLQIGRTISFKTLYGTVYPYNKLTSNGNDVLTMFNKTLQDSDLSVNRSKGLVTVATKNAEFIGSITSAVLEYDHVMIFENKTKLGVAIYDDVLNQTQKRLVLRGQRTANWNGTKTAPGYLVFDDHIVENFDSAVQSIDDMYRTDVDSFNGAFTQSKDLAIGNVNKTWADGLGINKNVLTKFHQGSIKQQGTTASIDRFNRASIVDEGITKLNAYDQYMFRQSELGNNDLEEVLEIELRSSDLVASPQCISTQDTPAGGAKAGVTYTAPERIINNKAITFDTKDFTYDWNFILTGGAALDHEVKYRILSADDISSVFEKTEPYALVPTWNNYTSYKKGEQVRHQGQLWKCSVNFTGLTETTATILETSRASRADFPHGTIAEIAGTSVTFNNTSTEYQPIIANGTATSPTFLPSETLVIDNINIGFSKTANVQVVTGPAIQRSTLGNVAFADVTGQGITINGTAISFGSTPANVIENFTGVNNGTALNPVLQATFTIAQALSGSTFSIASVTVNGTATTAYTLSGQNITFTTAPTAGQAIVITLTHVTVGITTTGIRDAINAAGVTGVTSSLVTASNVLEIAYAGGVGDVLIIAPAASNAALGFATGGHTIAVPVELQLQPAQLNITEIVAQINATSALVNVTASNVANKLKLVSTGVTLAVAGTARTTVGLNTTYSATTSTIAVPTVRSDAVTLIQAAITAAGNTEVTIATVGNNIIISSTGTSLTLGDTTFNTLAGFDTGTKIATDGGVVNTFDVTDFGSTAQTSDNALYNILVTDDSAFEVASRGSITTKFFGWNVLQVTQRPAPLYSYTEEIDGCGICAGTSTLDGNDAEVTTNVAHGLQVGDFVQLLNTTTTPNIDGIHKVTKVGTLDTVFYIDEFIEMCGNAVSIMPLVTTRFTDEVQRASAIALASWNLPAKTLIYEDSNASVLGTYVSNITGSTVTAKRQTLSRPTNKDIDNITVYNYKKNKSNIILESFDPLRHIIPGIAKQNVDIINVSDNAIYNTSSDTGQSVDDNNAWGTEQLGTRWWDTSKARYYDYDQGGLEYRVSKWGELYPGSEIVVWEWIKSSVAPDDYAESVLFGKEIYGVPATGEAYAVYDKLTAELVYHYTLTTQFNSANGSNDDVYYYWVKNKTTVQDERTLSAFDVANIIRSPSTNGVSWFAALTANEFIVDNISYYVDNKSTVLQINKAPNKFKSHNEWTLIAKGYDNIPGYYIQGMKYSLAGWNSVKARIPFNTLHKFNKYGDSLDIGQSWFNNINEGRRNTAEAINYELRSVLVDDAYTNKWDRTLVANNFPTTLWKWIDHKPTRYNGTFNYTTTATSVADLINIDRDFHKVVKIKLFNVEADLDRSEIYAYNDEKAEWVLVLKKNSSIEFSVADLCPEMGYDKSAEGTRTTANGTVIKGGYWDSGKWDVDNVAEYWQTLITALDEDIFIGRNKLKMNKLFFGVVDYVLSSLPQTNWIRKTTYIKVEIASEFNTTARKYKRNKIHNITGYIQDVKPFHTKISSTINSFATTEKVKASVTESLSIAVQTNTSGSTYDTNTRTFVHLQDNTGNVIAYALASAKETTLASELGLNDTKIIVTSTAGITATGTLYINGELITYTKVDATTVTVIARNVNNTFRAVGALGDSITQVDTNQLTYTNSPATLQYNVVGSTILNSPSSTAAAELSAISKGIQL